MNKGRGCSTPRPEEGLSPLSFQAGADVDHPAFALWRRRLTGLWVDHLRMAPHRKDYAVARVGEEGATRKAQVPEISSVHRRRLIRRQRVRCRLKRQATEC